MNGLLPLIAGLLLAFAGCAGIQRLDLSGAPTLTLEQLRAGPDAFADVTKAGYLGAVVPIAAGEKLPVRVALHSLAVELEGSDSTLSFTRDVYLFVSRTEILASPDRERWARLDDAKSLAELFGLEGGGVEVGFGVHRSKGPLVTIELGRLHPAARRRR
jgi:hypothetical protein